MNFELKTQLEDELISETTAKIKGVWEDCGKPTKWNKGPTAELELTKDPRWTKYSLDDIAWVTVYNNMTYRLLEMVDIHAPATVAPYWSTLAYAEHNWCTHSEEEGSPKGYADMAIEIIYRDAPELRRQVWGLCIQTIHDELDIDPTTLTDLPSKLQNEIVQNDDLFYIDCDQYVVYVLEESYPDKEAIERILGE